MRLFLRIRRTTSPLFINTKDSELIIEEKLAKNLQKWVADKKYHDSNKTMEEIASELDVSVEQLRRFFLIRMHDKFFHWRKMLRLEEAKLLLRLFPYEPIEMIGIRVGIDDKSNFRRQFIEEYGMTPGTWRERETRRHRIYKMLRVKKQVQKTNSGFHRNR